MSDEILTPENNDICQDLQNVSPDSNTDTLSQPLKKKRGRKPSGKRKGYFYEEEEKAFQEYLQTTDERLRNKIFSEKLYPAFTKMVESLIRRYGLFTPSESFEDTFCDAMSFLITKFNYFDASRGYKLYSYCGTICKNYLILKRSQDMKNTERHLPYNNEQDHRTVELKDSLSLNTELIQKSIISINKILQGNNLTETERKVGYALVELLTKWEDIFQQMETNKFNKTSFLYFVKAYTNLSTTDIRNAMKKYKNMYFLLKKSLCS